jgi:UDP-glucose 4-epimerase
MRKKVLVTCGPGFIGSHVVDLLVDEDYKVRIIEDLSTVRLENNQIHASSDKAELMKGDIRNASIVTKSLDGVSRVIRMAALLSVLLSVDNPNSTLDINLLETLNLLRLSIALGNYLSPLKNN